MDFELESNKNNEEKEQKEKEDLNNEEQEEENSINVYDNNAYMLEEDGSENNSKNDNNDNDYQENEPEKQNEIEGLDDFQNNEDNQEQNNYLKFTDQRMNINQNKKIDINNNLNNNINQINDINNKKNIEINENEIDSQNIDKINNENGELGEEGDEEGEGEEEENLPLVTLNYVSICQFCKNSFDSKNHLPYLFKCGHFFCKECIEDQFTDVEGIKCPIDGPIAKSIKEFKLLNNLITDKNIPTTRNENIGSKGRCHIHKGQKLTHIVINNKEILCVYCAFDLVRKNPNCEVKEIKELFEEYTNKADKIISINQSNVEIIQKSLKDIKDNKQREEKIVNIYFEHIVKYINTKKEEILAKIDSIFTDNATKLSQKLENFSAQIEMGESLKGLITNYKEKNNIEYNHIYETYLKMENLNDKDKNNKINLKEYKFIHDDESKIMKYINYFGDIKSTYKYIPFKNNSYETIDMDDKNDNSKQNYYSYNSTDITTNNNINYKNYFLTKKKNNSFILDNDSDFTNTYLQTQEDLRTNKYNKKTFNYIDYPNINKSEIYNNNNNTNINWIKYNGNKEKYNNNLNNNIFKYKRTDCDTSKRINSPIFYRINTCNIVSNKEGIHRFSSPMTYTYTFQRNNK